MKKVIVSFLFVVIAIAVGALAPQGIENERSKSPIFHLDEISTDG